MFVFGLLMLAIAILVAVVVIVAGTQTVLLDLHWFTVRTEVSVILVVGLVCMLAAVLGLWLAIRGSRRARRRRGEMAALRERAERSERAQREARAHTGFLGGVSEDADASFESIPRDSSASPPKDRSD